MIQSPSMNVDSPFVFLTSKSQPGSFITLEELCSLCAVNIQNTGVKNSFSD